MTLGLGQLTRKTSVIVFSQELATEADRLARDRQKGGNSAMTGPRPPPLVRLISVRVRAHKAGMWTAVGFPSNNALITFFDTLKTNKIFKTVNHQKESKSTPGLKEFANYGNSCF